MIDIRNLDGRYRCIIRYAGALKAAVISPERLSPSKEHIEIGDFWSDELPRAWNRVDEIQIVEVLSKVDVPSAPPPGWLARSIGWLQCRIGLHDMRKIIPQPPHAGGNLGAARRCSRGCGEEWGGLPPWPRPRIPAPPSVRGYQPEAAAGESLPPPRQP